MTQRFSKFKNREKRKVSTLTVAADQQQFCPDTSVEQECRCLLFKQFKISVNRAISPSCRSTRKVDKR